MENKTIESKLTYYELQKEKYKSVEPLDAIEVMKRLTEVSQKMLDTDSAYFMLLCRENNDYTTLVLTSATEIDALKKSLLELLQLRGDIMDIYDDENSSDSWDIWIKDNTGDCYLMKLFDSCDFVEIVY